MEKKIGHYSFVVGVVLAIVLGLARTALAGAELWLTSLLVLAGLVVGFLNVSGKETKEFVFMALILVLLAYAGSAAGTLTKVQYIGPYLADVLASIFDFVVPATIVVALKDIYSLSQTK